MKKIMSTFVVAALAVALLAGCGNDAASSTDTATSSTSEAASTDVADTAKLDSIVSTIEAVNEVPNPRAIDDFSLENEMGLTPDNIVAFKGDVTNDQADCALVFAAQAKSGTVDTVKSELEAYKESMSSTLYAEFADKVAKAEDCRIVTSGNFVVMVISGINGPDYSEIDTAIENALA